MNNICIVGRIGQDLELKQTPNGIAVCSFTVAVKRPNVKDTTDWIPCVAWRQSAEYVCRYGKKGSLVAVTGVMTTRTFEKDGQKRTFYEIAADALNLLSESNSSAPKQGVGYDANNAPAPYSAESVAFKEMTADDSLPF